MARLQAAQADLAALSAGEAGSLRVGTFQSVGAKILPAVMRRYASAWPEVEIELQESHSDVELSGAVERGDLDLSFVQLPLDNPALETQELLRDQYVLVVAAGSPLAAREKAPSLREIAEQPLIGSRNCRALRRTDRGRTRRRRSFRAGRDLDRAQARSHLGRRAAGQPAASRDRVTA